jgi:hypothetical protein
MSQSDDQKLAARQLCRAVADRDLNAATRLLDGGARADVLTPILKPAEGPIRFPSVAPANVAQMTAVGVAITEGAHTDLMELLLPDGLQAAPVVALVGGRTIDVFEFLVEYSHGNRCLVWNPANTDADDMVECAAVLFSKLQPGATEAAYQLGDHILRLLLPSPTPAGLSEILQDNDASSVQPPSAGQALVTTLRRTLHWSRRFPYVHVYLRMGAKFRPLTWSKHDHARLWDALLFHPAMTGDSSNAPLAFHLVAIKDKTALAVLASLLPRLNLNRRWLGMTLLHHACAHGSIHTIEWLLGNGANPEAHVMPLALHDKLHGRPSNFVGLTPSEVAALAGHPEAAAAIGSWKSRAIMRDTLARGHRA